MRPPRSAREDLVVCACGGCGWGRGMRAEGYDVAVVGGSFSGASTALLLRRRMPGLRVAIIERSAAFDRKVGEATTEVSGSFLTKQLGLSHHLAHHHLPKQGLRFWFSGENGGDFARCGEIGGYYQVRMPSFQVDRQVLDQHILDLAAAEGADLMRPAKVLTAEPGEPGRIVLEAGGEKREITARWIIDASGRAALLARKFGHFTPLADHPTSSVWARFRGVGDLDGHGLRSRNPEFARACQASRAAATNHLTGYGWWCWIIPLKGGDTSAGIVYDERLFELPPGENLGGRLLSHLRSHPVGRELFRDAEVVAGDVKAYSSLPYFSREIAGPGWQITGDAAGFLDPLYSAGLDYCSWTICAAVARVLGEISGKQTDLGDINAWFRRSYDGWFNALYRDKYHYLGDAQLMRAAFLMDLGWFYFGPVRELCIGPEGGFERFPFDGPVDGAVGKLMAFCNRRLRVLAQKKRDQGTYGDCNLDSRMLVSGFEPTPKALLMVCKGIRHWLMAEWHS